MGILLYSNNGRECEERLLRVINDLPQRHTLEIYHTIKDIPKRFRQPRGDLAIMVLLGASIPYGRGDLSFNRCIHLLSKIKVVIQKVQLPELNERSQFRSNTPGREGVTWQADIKE